MKPFLQRVILLGVVLALHSACSHYEKPISKEQLPQPAREFLNAHFAGDEISQAMRDNDWLRPDFKVYFKNGMEVSFQANGKWNSVEGNGQPIPTSFLLPQINDYVKANYPGLFLEEIDRNGAKFDVKLSNGMEMVFSSSGAFLGFED